MQLNESGGRVDETDPKYRTWLQKQKKHSKDDPRRIPYKLSDVFWPHEVYAPILDRFVKASADDNFFSDVPLSILLEVKEAIETRSTPSWFFATIDMEALRDAIDEPKMEERE